MAAAVLLYSFHLLLLFFSTSATLRGRANRLTAQNLSNHGGRTTTTAASSNSILSDLQTSRITQTESELSDDAEEPLHQQQQQQHQHQQQEEDDDDSLIDDLHDSTPSQLRLEQLFTKVSDNYTTSRPRNLDTRINNWRNSNRDDLIDDNVASWDLDEDLISQILDKTIIRNEVGGLSKSHVPSNFYGDDFLKNLNKKDYIKFKNITKNLKKSLNTNQKETTLDLVNKIISNYHQNNQNTLNRGNLVNKMHHHQKRYSSILNESTTTNDNTDYTFNPTYHDDGFRMLEQSETATSSSLVLCGGVGFGGNSSWGDI
ncbi:hypothetical protein QCA50_009221 [Cerrena zonata]|uniref:Uncharacterized protein n=1 Tax=Cerrena zonata TaxID=2478898 RepID=A0AAW0G2U8_9APHY